MMDFMSWEDGTAEGDPGCEIRGKIIDGVIYVEEVRLYDRESFEEERG